MRGILSLIVSLYVILISIEHSSQFDCLPNGAPISGVPCSETSDSPTTHQSPVTDIPVTASSSEQPHGVRLRFPPARHPSSRVLGYEIEHLSFIRFIPKTNPNQRFEIRKYTFPPDTPIHLRGRNKVVEPMPSGEQYVLSTSNGDIFAILGDRNQLRAIYAIGSGHKRVKVNMESGKAEVMALEETKEAPVGINQPVSTKFRTEASDHLRLENLLHS